MPDDARLVRPGPGAAELPRRRAGRRSWKWPALSVATTRSSSGPTTSTWFRCRG